jgi:hypothetical protein
MRYPVLIATSVILLGSLNGCLGGAALMALSAAGGATAIAKDVFDIDVDIHTLLGQAKPAAPIPPAALVVHPEYLVVTPPPNPSLNGK